MRRATVFLALTLGATLAWPANAAAQDASGEAEKVSQSAEASGTTGSRVLQVAAPVFMGDQIRTDRQGEAQIRFADDTRFVIGANARVTVDSFSSSAPMRASPSIPSCSPATRQAASPSPPCAAPSASSPGTATRAPI